MAKGKAPSAYAAPRGRQPDCQPRAQPGDPRPATTPPKLPARSRLDPTSRAVAMESRWDAGLAGRRRRTVGQDGARRPDLHHTRTTASRLRRRLWRPPQAAPPGTARRARCCCSSIWPTHHQRALSALGIPVARRPPCTVRLIDTVCTGCTRQQQRGLCGVAGRTVVARRLSVRFPTAWTRL
jgi:hypothetical protein